MKNKNLFLSICLIAVSAISFAQEQKATKLHVGTTTAASAASAALDITSTTKGFLIPRMTTAQRTAIATPAEGLEVYDTTTKTSWYYNGTAWVQDATGSASKFVDGTTATDAVYTGGNVGIGTTNPAEKLEVTGSIKMVDGNQAAGKLMVSDAAGKATWTSVATALGTSASKWTNDATNTRVALTNLSDGTTARPAGTEFQISDSGSFGMGLSPNSNNRLWVEGLSKTLYTANANGETHNSIYASGQPIVNAGVTVTGGTITSLNAGIVRTGATNAGAFTGVHSRIAGVWSAYGHHTSLDPGAISENVFGFFANPYAQQGTITNLYDFYGANIYTTGGTVTNRYGIAIEGTNKINYFMGNVGIGTTTPTTKLDVAGSIKVGNDGDTATNGTIRYNSTTNKFQGYAAGAWVDLH